MQILEGTTVNDGTMNHLNIIWVENMTRKTNTALIALLGTILMGLSTWVLITLIELQTIVAMMQQELMSLDKVFGRIYAHMDRLANR
jgi:hypothetical protein|tara:strand:+ start:270 stop:530 length:261 start_codon:yes stop_codon:yes gene_type:complete